MNKSDELLDLSLIKTQNKIALLLKEFLSIEELEDVIESKILMDYKRDVNEIKYIVYSNVFEKSNTKVELLDIMILDSVPAKRFMDYRVSKGNQYQIDIKYHYSKKQFFYWYNIIAKAINYIKYKSPTDININNKNIINNFSNILSKYIKDKESIEEARLLMEYINGDENILDLDKPFMYNFTISNIKYQITTNEYGLIKFSFIVDEKINSIYFSRNKIGISNVCLVLTKVLNKFD